MPKFERVPLHLVDDPAIPSRAVFDQVKLEELAESVKLHGVIEPVLLERAGERFRVIAGHRRTIASRMAYLDALPAMVYEPGEYDADALMLEENMCRDDVTPAEQGWFILRLAEEKGYSMEQLMRKFKRSENWINERVELVRFDADVAAAVAERKIVFGIAKELMRCKDDKARGYFLSQAITHGVNIRTVSFWIDQWKQNQDAAAALATPQPAGPVQPVVPTVDNTPHCALCGCRDAAQNMIQVLVHYYHWNPVKKFLRDNGIEVFEAPRE